MNKLLFVCYPRCTTCKKAREWLTAKGLAFDERDIKAHNPAERELREWHAKSGLPLKRFFNTSGQLYRENGVAARLAGMSEEECFALLASDGMMVKRPIVVADTFVLVGFRQSEWEQAFAGQTRYEAR